MLGPRAQVHPPVLHERIPGEVHDIEGLRRQVAEPRAPQLLVALPQPAVHLVRPKTRLPGNRRDAREEETVEVRQRAVLLARPVELDGNARLPDDLPPDVEVGLVAHRPDPVVEFGKVLPAQHFSHRRQGVREAVELGQEIRGDLLHGNRPGRATGEQAFGRLDLLVGQIGRPHGSCGEDSQGEDDEAAYRLFHRGLSVHISAVGLGQPSTIRSHDGKASRILPLTMIRTPLRRTARSEIAQNRPVC